MLICSVDAPSYSGKSSLLAALSVMLPPDLLHTCDDYVPFLGGEDHIPETPRWSSPGELDSLMFFLEADRKRWEDAATRIVGHQVVLLDRSIHTLLAHTLGIRAYTGIDIFPDACRAAEQCGSRVPEITFYLDVPQDELTRRIALRQDRTAAIFQSPIYNKGFCSYFFPTLKWGASRIVALDGTQSVRTLADCVVAQLDAVLPGIRPRSSL